MARIINNNGYSVDSSASSRNPDGFSHETHPLAESSQLSSTDDLRSKIERSAIYQQAYALFSKAEDKIWLQRLESIVGSVVGANKTWLDDIGLSNKYNDKMQSIEAEAYNQIQKLVSEYQSYKQDLPITQVQDMADAGINSAITGNGIDGASISGDASQRDMSPYQMESTNPLESISTIGNLLFSASDGILSALQVFNQIGVSNESLELSKRSQLVALQKQLSDLGFYSAPFSASVEDFDKWWSEYGLQESIDLNIGSSTVKKLRSTLQHHLGVTAKDRFISEKGHSIINKMVDFEITTWEKSAEYKKAYSEYMALYQSTLDPVKMANLNMDKEQLQKELLSKQNKLQSLNNELVTGRNNAIKDWIESAGDDAQARAIIARVLMNVSATESVQLQNFDEYSGVQRLNNFISPIGAITGTISNLPML